MKKLLLFFVMVGIIALSACSSGTMTEDVVEIDASNEGNTVEDNGEADPSEIIEATGEIQEIEQTDYRLEILVDDQALTFEMVPEFQDSIRALELEVGVTLSFTYYTEDGKNWINNITDVVLPSEETATSDDEYQYARGVLKEKVDETTYMIENEYSNYEIDTFILNEYAKKQNKMQEPKVGDTLDFSYTVVSGENQVFLWNSLTTTDNEGKQLVYMYTLPFSPSNPDEIDTRDLMSNYGTLYKLSDDYAWIGDISSDYTSVTIHKLVGEATSDLNRLGVKIGDQVMFHVYNGNEVGNYEYEEVVPNFTIFRQEESLETGTFNSADGNYAYIDFWDSLNNVNATKIKLTQDSKKYISEFKAGDNVIFEHFIKNGESYADGLDFNQ